MQVELSLLVSWPEAGSSFWSPAWPRATTGTPQSGWQNRGGPERGTREADSARSRWFLRGRTGPRAQECRSLLASGEGAEAASPLGAAEGTAALPAPGFQPRPSSKTAGDSRSASHHRVVSFVPQTWKTDPTLIITLSSLNINRVQQTFTELLLRASLCKGADGDTPVWRPEPGTLGP